MHALACDGFKSKFSSLCRLRKLGYTGSTKASDTSEHEGLYLVFISHSVSNVQSPIFDGFVRLFTFLLQTLKARSCATNFSFVVDATIPVGSLTGTNTPDGFPLRS